MSPLRWLSSLLVLSLFSILGSALAAQPPVAGLNLPAYAADRVLVKFRPGTDPVVKAMLRQQTHGQVMKRVPAIGLTVIQVPSGAVAASVERYRANPNVVYAEPDYYRVLVVPNEEPGPTPAGGANYFDEQWYLNNTGQPHTRVLQTPLGPELQTVSGTDGADINAPEGWDVSQGRVTLNGAVYNTPKVAVLDSGADCATLELSGKCLEKTSLVGLTPSALWDACDASHPACDNLGHGTFTAAEIAANTDNGEGVAGVGWHTGVGIFKVCYQELVTDGLNYYFVGLCPVSASAEAIALAATDQVDGGILTRSQYQVISMSYGSDLIDPDTGVISPTDGSSAECDAIRLAVANGVVVVAAAGNNGNTDRVYPAACTDTLDTQGNSTVIAVAASDDNDDRAAFSSYSVSSDPWVSLAAPGDEIIGILPDAQCGLASGVDSCVDWWSGTSMSAPLVAGSAALVWSQLYASLEISDPSAPLAPALCNYEGMACNAWVRQRLENSAAVTGARGQNLLAWTTHGRLDLAAALAGSVTPPPAPLVAAFSYRCVGLDCDFDASASHDGIQTYTWELGVVGVNAIISGTPNYAYSYPVNGDYSVTLTVADAAGQSATVTTTLTLKAGRKKVSGSVSSDSAGSGGSGGSGGGGKCSPGKAAQGKC